MNIKAKPLDLDINVKNFWKKKMVLRIHVNPERSSTRFFINFP